MQIRLGLTFYVVRGPDRRKPTLIREWRVSIIREKIQYLGRVVAPDKEAAIARAMEEFRIEPARRFRLIVVPVE